MDKVKGALRRLLYPDVVAGTVFVVFVAVIFSFVLGGCAAKAKVIDPIVFEPAAPHAPPALEQLVVNEPHVLIPPEVVEVKAGDVVPHDGFLVKSMDDLPPFVGYLIARDDWERLVEAYPRRIDEIEDLVAQVAADRLHCSAVDAAKIEAILACREAKKEAFTAGIAIGAGGCAVVYGALDRIVP
mgnify:CR=1 FL=1|jgi:hypothetical protein